MRRLGIFFGLIVLLLFGAFAFGAKDFTARELIAKVLGRRSTSGFRIHARLIRTITGSDQNQVTQLLIKGRQEARTRQLIYRVLWPKARAGQALLIHRTEGQATTGWLFEPPDKVTQLTPQLARLPFFGTDISLEDIIEDFWRWPSQTLGGEEIVNKHPCKILESRAPAESVSGYSLVKSWIAPELALPLRLEKYDLQSNLVKRFIIEKLHKDSHGDFLPAILLIDSANGRTRTRFEGTKFESDLQFSPTDFSIDKLQQP